MLFPKLLEKANKLAASAKKSAKKIQVADQRILFSGESARLRWMVLPIEAKEALLSRSTKNNMNEVTAPFEPKTFHSPNEMEHSLTSLISAGCATDDSVLEAGSLLSKLNLKVSEEYLVKKYT